MNKKKSNDQDRLAASFSDWFREQLADLGYAENLAAVGRMVGLSRQTVNSYFNKSPHHSTGRMTKPAPRTIIRIADKLGLDAAEGLRRAGYEPSQYLNAMKRPAPAADTSLYIRHIVALTQQLPNERQKDILTMVRALVFQYTGEAGAEPGASSVLVEPADAREH